MPDIHTAILSTRDYVTRWAAANGWELPFALKRRDPAEPGRRRKEKAEDQLYRIMRRYWFRQKLYLKEWMRFRFPMRKAISDIPLAELNGMYADEIFNAQVLNWFLKAVKDGTLLMSETGLLEIDYTVVNTAASKWARKHAAKFVTGIDNKTKADIAQQIGAFIDTPGMTIGDLMKNLPFTEDRALMIATTETTNAYAVTAQIEGQELQKEFPETRVIKRFYTNRDDRVCPICQPLHGMVVDIDEGFTTEEDKSLGVPYPPLHPRCRCWIVTTTETVRV